MPIPYRHAAKQFRDAIPELKDFNDQEILEIIKTKAPKLAARLDTSDSIIDKIRDVPGALQRGATSGWKDLLNSVAGAGEAASDAIEGVDRLLGKAGVSLADVVPGGGAGAKTGAAAARKIIPSIRAYSDSYVLPDWAKQNVGPNTLSSVMEGVGSAPATIEKYAAAAMAGGPLAGGFVAGAAPHYGEGADSVLVHGGLGALLGGASKYLSGKSLPAKVLGGGAIGAVTNPEDPMAGIILGAGLPLVMGGGKKNGSQVPQQTAGPTQTERTLAPPPIPKGNLTGIQQQIADTTGMSRAPVDPPEVLLEVLGEGQFPVRVEQASSMRPVTVPTAIQYGANKATGVVRDKPPVPKTLLDQIREVAEKEEADKFLSGGQPQPARGNILKMIEEATGIRKVPAPVPESLLSGADPSQRVGAPREMLSPPRAKDVAGRAGLTKKSQPIEVPETGVPEPTQRHKIALDNISQNLLGKPFSKATVKERAVVRALADEGFGYNVTNAEPSIAPDAQPVQVTKPSPGKPIGSGPPRNLPPKQGFSVGAVEEEPGTVLGSGLGGFQGFGGSGQKKTLPSSLEYSKLRQISDRWVKDREQHKPGMVAKFKDFARLSLSGIVDPLEQPLRVAARLEDAAGKTEKITTISGDIRVAKDRKLLPTDLITATYDRAHQARSIADEVYRSSGIEQARKDLVSGYGYRDRYARIKDADAYMLAKQAKAVEIRKLGEEAAGKPGSGFSKQDLADPDKIRSIGEAEYNARLSQNRDHTGFTGKPYGEIEDVIKAGAEEYSGFAGTFTAAVKKFKDIAVESGLLSEEKSAYLDKVYPDYVPLTVVEESIPVFSHGAGSPASLSAVKSFQKLVGSDKIRESPILSSRQKLDRIVSEAARNNAAKALVDGFESLPGGNAYVSPATAKTKAEHKISLWRDGKQVEYEVDPIIANAAKNLNPVQADWLVKSMQFASRLVQTSATGLNAEFAVANMARDTTTGAVTTPSLRAVFDPKVWLKSLRDATVHGKDWRELRSMGGGFNQYIGYRDTAQKSVELEVALDAKGIVGKAGGALAYYGKHPLRGLDDAMRMVESVVGRSEDVTRLKGYHSSLDEYRRLGYSDDVAKVRAVNDSNNLAGPNYLRKGMWTRGLFTMFPYLNARTQGTKLRIGRFVDNPISTTIRYMGLIALPKVVSTMWNLSSEERRKAMEDAREYIRDGSIYFLDDNPVKDEETGYWSGFRIPVGDGLGQFSGLLEDALIAYQKEDPQAFKAMTDAMFANIEPGEATPVKIPSPGVTDVLGRASGAVLPFPLTAKDVGDTMVPQFAKGIYELKTGVNSFSGKPARTEQEIAINQPRFEVERETSSVLEKAANAMGKSPKELQFQLGTPFGHGGAFMHGLNLIDRIAQVAGVVDRVGGRSIPDALSRRQQIPGNAARHNVTELEKPMVQAGSDAMVAGIGDDLYRYVRDQGVALGPVGKRDGELPEEYQLRAEIRGLALHKMLAATVEDLDGADKVARRKAIQHAITKAGGIAGRLTSRRGWDKLDPEVRVNLLRSQLDALR